MFTRPAVIRSPSHRITSSPGSSALDPTVADGDLARPPRPSEDRPHGGERRRSGPCHDAIVHGADLAIRGRRVVTPEGVREACLHVSDGTIGLVAAFDQVPSGVPLVDVGRAALELNIVVGLDLAFPLTHGRLPSVPLLRGYCTYR